MALHTFTSQDAVELAVVERSGFIESRHVGAAVLLDPQGAPVVALGATDQPVFVRSTLKPLQAIASMRAGAELDGPAAVLATASHRSEQRHIDVVTDMLASVGLDETALQCPSVIPSDRSAREARTAAGHPRSPLHFNCSGKHAAFLLAAVAGGHDLRTYLDPAHPVQQEVEAVVRAYTGGPPLAIGTDGCGAPVHALTLRALAAGIGRVAQRADAEAESLMDAVLEHPWGIEGAGRPNTTVIEELGIFAKFGAEGVMVMATPDGWSVAVKCLDGSSRPTTRVALALLGAVGAVDAQAAEDLGRRLTTPVTGGIDNGGDPQTVGAVRLGEAVTEVQRSGA
ncbi:MAG TPA: asparaginase [Brevibacterium senegalense]|uniref:Asparaginase n=1 Tax=Brevibacterium senegalense TaxID=1033736 RepID=A0A921MES2_9MICO|nr:asparaginase [Brevibacterium senegalense]